ncbi:MAG: hypothetical protein GX416_06915, partial [Bacteroidales bacterium]|nr:hypothetical protein [Bacteroidales bacterium]
TKEKVVIFGNANNMGRELLKEKNGYIKTTEKIAEQYAKKGGLAVISYINKKSLHGHVATYSVGKNIKKGEVTNIGGKDYTGYVSLNKVVSKNKEKYFFIYIPGYYIMNNIYK